MTIGELIRERRKSMGLSQEQLAAILNTTKATVSRWETGDIHKMKRSSISSLSKVLDLDPMVFFQYQDILLPDEKELIDAYRAADEITRSNIRKLLDLPDTKKDTAALIG